MKNRRWKHGRGVQNHNKTKCSAALPAQLNEPQCPAHPAPGRDETSDHERVVAHCRAEVYSKCIPARSPRTTVFLICEG